ncbi:hypothetical protein FRB99_000792, partial [Tulasnella sp. 403]
MAWNVPFSEYIPATTLKHGYDLHPATTGALFILRALEYSLVSAGRLKLGERVPGEHHLDPKASVAQKLAWGLSDSIELCVSQRGIGWDFGTGEGLRLPPMQTSRPIHDRFVWLRTTLLRDVLVNYLVVDIINTWWRTIPQISSPLPSEKAFHELPISLRYAVPGTVMVVVATYMSLGYEVAAVLDVALLGREPSAWPVLFGEPWKAQSLHDLWAKEWHQLSRRTFLYSLGYPLRALFGTPGMMMGAFTASGLYHNLMLIGDGQPGLDIPTMSFFVAQGFGVIFERLFRQITGRKVEGLLGNLWVIAFLLITVQPFATVWINRGLPRTTLPKHPDLPGQGHTRAIYVGAYTTSWRHDRQYISSISPVKRSHLISSPSLVTSGFSRPASFRHKSTTATTNPFDETDMGKGANAKVSTTERLAALRELMAKPEYNVDVYIVPSEDQHSSEYLADCDARRAFISGFNGSAGCAVITRGEAYMFTDGRYFLQAAEQMDHNWTLMKHGMPGNTFLRRLWFAEWYLTKAHFADVPTWQEFLSKNLPDNTRIGIDPTLIVAVDAKTIKDALTPKKSELVSLPTNLVDLVWAGSRPSRPANKVFPLAVKYSGQSSEEKISKLRQELAKQKAAAMVVNMLDEVAWLFNLRGSDIDFNPVFFAYALVTPTKVILYINPAQLSDAKSLDDPKHLSPDLEIRPYDTFFDELRALGASLGENEKVLVGSRASLAVVSALGEKKAQVVRSPVADEKALKNDTEVEGFRQCHLRDGAALARYFAWLEEQLNLGVELSESQAADQLEKYRSEGDLFKGLSFTTISSTGPNGAIIHYSPDPQTCAIVLKDQMYLCDSGGLSTDGRTIPRRNDRRNANMAVIQHFGEPTPEEKRAFTRVLQGHIAIDTAVFPNGTTGYIIDAFARRALWQEGLDYRHGTGHGVGHFLNVHEGPQGISMRPSSNETPLKKGMTVSNEPGYYADGKFGIRIESIVIVQDAQTPNNFGSKGYLRFENVTMCPIHTKLVDPALMAPQEVRWLDDYHAEVLRKIRPLLEAKGDVRAVKWLEKE